ncbi:MAG: hypothetical protein ACR5K7_01195 [Symbiopectobacterium sp.]
MAGIIGLVSLFTSLLAHMLGARRLWQRLWLVVPLLGTSLLIDRLKTIVWADPHLARMIGFFRMIPQFCCSVLIGGILMLLADYD